MLGKWEAFRKAAYPVIASYQDPYPSLSYMYNMPHRFVQNSLVDTALTASAKVWCSNIVLGIFSLSCQNCNSCDIFYIQYECDKIVCV